MGLNSPFSHNIYLKGDTMTLVQTRPDHGVEHTGKYACYVRVSTDKQDVKNQMYGIKAYLNGGEHTIKWFKEEGVSAASDWYSRKELHKCFDYCRRTGATMVVYSLSRMSRRTWETLRFFDQEVSTGRIKLVVVDNPNLDHKTIGLLAGVYEMERQMIRDRTKASMNRIKAEIKEKGSYTSKAGNLITKMGNPEIVSKAAQKGREQQVKIADERARELWPIISNLLDSGYSIRAIARQLNEMKVPTPAKRRNSDLSKQTQWYASSVKNYVVRMADK